MTNARRAVASLTLIFAAATAAWAQTGSTEPADGIKWLERNLAGAACVAYDVGPSAFRLERVTEDTEVTFDGCRMTLHQAVVRGTHSEVRTFAISLGALDAGSVSVREGFVFPEGWTTAGDVPTHTVQLAIPNGERVIESRVETFDGAAPREYRTHAVDLLVRHQENADRIVRALTRAIAQCRLP